MNHLFQRRRHIESLKLKLYLVRLPRRDKEGKELKTEIAMTEQFISALIGFRKPFTFEVAVPHIGEEIHFYTAIDSSLSEAFVRQVQSLWNEAQVQPAEDYNIFNYSGVTMGARIKLRDTYVLPIKTYDELGADTFLPFLGGFTKVNEVGEGAALQIIVRPISSDYKGKIRSALRMLQRGASLGEALKQTSSAFSDFLNILGGEKKGSDKDKIVDEVAVKALERKISKPLFEINARVLASAPSDFQATEIFQGITAGFSQFGAPERNTFSLLKSKNVREIAHQFSFREFLKNDAMVLNSEEIASIFHFPTVFTDIPRIKEVKSKEAGPPPNLPKTGTLIGKSFYRGEERAVRIEDEDRRRHVYIIGQTGTGKSNLLTNMAVEDIENGKGLAVLDPHGDFVEDILSRVPKNRLEDVIVFDPGDIERPLGINMIEFDLSRPEEKTFIVNEMQSIFNKLFTTETMGPMFEQYMRNALLLLMEDMATEPATLMEVARVFTDAEFRKRKLARITNPSVQDFWEKEAVKAGGEASLSNITPYITSKFNNFTANDYMRVIIGQAKSAFNFRRVMDDGKILLVNLSKGRIGDINANLLGMILVGKFLMAALSRVDMPQEKRRDFNLYIDEFQNFTTDSIAVILSEARKYRLNLVIAHQFVAQLTDSIRDAVFGNVGSLVAFRVGAQDTETLIKQFEPVFSEQDMLNIDNFNAYVKLLMRGETSKPFNIKTIPAKTGEAEKIADLKNFSREHYGRPRQQVEEEILKRLRG